MGEKRGDKGASPRKPRSFFKKSKGGGGARGKDGDRPLPAGWKATKDPKSGKPYYYHRASGEVSWKRPKAAPADGTSTPESDAAAAPSKGGTAPSVGDDKSTTDTVASGPASSQNSSTSSVAHEAATVVAVNSY